MLQTIKRILREEDLESLLAAGAPSNEYDAEAERIAEAIHEWNLRHPSEMVSRERLALMVKEVWFEMFEVAGPNGDRELAYERVAARIVSACHSTQQDDCIS